MNEAMERRKSFRMPFNAEVFFQTNGTDFHGVIENLSSTGFLMKTDNYPPEAIEFEMEIVLKGQHSKLKIENIKGQVVRCGESGVGVKFSDRLEWVALIPIYYYKVQEAKLT